MSSKIEVSRELIAAMRKTCKITERQWDELNAACAAPVVERQPVAVLMLGEVFHGTNGPEVDDWDINWDREAVEKLAVKHPGEHFELFTAPPELAELQATIERLRAELGECKGEYDRAVNKVDALRGQLAEAHALFADVLSIDIPRTAESLERMRSILSGSAEPAPIAWHVGGNGYDEVYFSYPAWASKLGDACPAINAINDVSTLAIMFRGGSIVSKGRAEPTNKERE
jgi:hypothetical protein